MPVLQNLTPGNTPRKTRSSSSEDDDGERGRSWVVDYIIDTYDADEDLSSSSRDVVTRFSSFVEEREQILFFPRHREENRREIQSLLDICFSQTNVNTMTDISEHHRQHCLPTMEMQIHARTLFPLSHKSQ